MNLSPNFFRHQFSIMVPVITKLMGLEYEETAEEIVSQTLITASESWALKGVPQKPQVWLHNLAIKLLIQFLRKNILFFEKLALETNNNTKSVEKYIEEKLIMNFLKENITDSQLQLLFAICNPAISDKGQIGLALRSLCGFGIDSIAEAFLEEKEIVQEKIDATLDQIRKEKIKMEFPSDEEVHYRIDNVLRVIYLIFNEGYYSSTQNKQLRKDVSIEAMRLCKILLDNEQTNLPQTNALMSLMCFNASRFDARIGADGNYVLYEDQDKRLWNNQLIEQGSFYLGQAATGNVMTSFHLEAAIASYHSHKEEEGKWGNILRLYNNLININHSPAVALNRVYALYKAQNAQVAIKEAEKLKATFQNNHFYFTLLGELYSQINIQAAMNNFEKAIVLAKSERDKEVINDKIDGLFKV